MDKLLHLGVTEIAKLVGASKASIFLLDRHREEMTMRAVYGYDESMVHGPNRLEGGALGRAAKVSPDATRSPGRNF